MSSVYLTVCDEGGSITRVIELDLHEPYAVLGKYSDETHYIDVATMQPVAKHEMEPQVSVEGMEVKLLGLPVPSQVYAGPHRLETDDPDVTLMFDAPGVKEILVTSPRYLDFRVEAHVE